MIVRTADRAAQEKCLSSEYRQCPAAHLQASNGPVHESCPNLQESLVQYCSAANLTKFIPYSESLISRCGTDNHDYCELFLSLAHPAPGASHVPGGGPALGDAGEDTEHSLENISVPGWLYYSPNHMWMNVSEDGRCHIGIDAFLAKVIGRADGLSFVTAKGLNHPAAVLSIRGTDLPVVFPNKVLITGVNYYLRANLEKLTADPYSLGWLFECQEQEPSETGNSRSSLIRGNKAASWMQSEVRRMNRFVHENLQFSQNPIGPVMMDGGSFVGGVAAHLSREELLFLFNEFFPFYASWRRLL